MMTWTIFENTWTQFVMQSFENLILSSFKFGFQNNPKKLSRHQASTSHTTQRLEILLDDVTHRVMNLLLEAGSVQLMQWCSLHLRCVWDVDYRPNPKPMKNWFYFEGCQRFKFELQHRRSILIRIPKIQTTTATGNFMECLIWAWQWHLKWSRLWQIILSHPSSQL